MTCYNQGNIAQWCAGPAVWQLLHYSLGIHLCTDIQTRHLSERVLPGSELEDNPLPIKGSLQFPQWDTPTKESVIESKPT